MLVSTYSPFAVGGIGQFVHDLSIALHRRGIQVTALYRYEKPEFGPSDAFADAARLAEIRPRNVKGWRTLSVNRRTAAWIARNRTDIDVLHLLNPMPMAAAGLRAGHRFGIPSVVTIYAKYPRSANPLLRKINSRAERILLEENDVLAFESENTAREFANSRGRVVLNGIDTDYFRPRPELRIKARVALGLSETTPVILFLGRMDRLKGIYVFLEALKLLSGRVDGLVALLVGSVEVGDLEDRIGQLGLKQVVRVIGPVGKLDVLDYYCAADLFVLPSYLEGISSALVEAMSIALPVVATGVGGNPEVVRDGIEGLLIPPGDPRALARAMERIILDAQLRKRMGSAARSRIESAFSLEAMTDQYIAAYAEAREKVTRETRSG